ncbi:hypothetical protein ABES80_12310 [Bacillus gobiensis]|uniref:hypothetical protein n=1 Tax=Bacillus gobiensis TaxID=1441095 RepID=UPI003D258D4A
MNIVQLDGKLKDLNNHIPSFKSLRVELAYRDVLNIFSLYTELRMQIEGNDIHELLNKGEIEKVEYTRFRQRQIVSLMKSLFVYIDPFVNIFLQEITQIKEDRYFTEKLIRDFYVSNNNILSQDVILPIYCAVIYRNKLIVHHDIIRTDVTSLDKIIPVTEDFSFLNTEKTQALYSYREDYKNTIPSLKNEKNLSTILKILFYSVPLFKNGTINPDRKKINELIETGGCESLSPKELMKSLDLFIDEVINTVK